MKRSLKEIAYLGNNDVISAEVSDHHPILHNGVLFWNVMMQGRKRQGRDGMSYNNGFGIEESNTTYLNRLTKIAYVIAEIVERNKTIEAICLCEGPIQPEHVNRLLETLKMQPAMQKFFENQKPIFQQPHHQSAPNWGLMMFAQADFEITPIQHDFIQQSIVQNKLANRLQTWQLKKGNKSKYLTLGHFPFSGDEHVSDQSQLSDTGTTYCQLLKKLFEHHAKDELVICADFNFNPHLISERQDRSVDKIKTNNSIVLVPDNKNHLPLRKHVTVDGILLSQKEKQKFMSVQVHSCLFKTLKRESKMPSTVTCLL